MTRNPDINPQTSRHDRWLSALLLAFCLLFAGLVVTTPANLPDIDDITLEQAHSAPSMEATDHTGDEVALPLVTLQSPSHPHHNGAYHSPLLPRISAEFLPGSRPPDLS